MKRKEKDLTGTQYMYTSYKQIMWPKQRLVQWYAVGEKIDLTDVIYQAISIFTKQKKTFHQPKEISASVVPSFFVFVEPPPVVAKVLALDAAGNVCNRIVNCLI